jgi:hypothetical protein
MTTDKTIEILTARIAHLDECVVELTAQVPEGPYR